MLKTLPDLAKPLLNIERGIHRRGWDQPPILYTMTEIRPGVLTASDVFVGFPGDPGAILADMADFAMANSRQFSLAHRSQFPGPFAGFAFMAEAWGIKSGPDLSAVDVRKFRGDRPLSEHPDRIEIRQITIVDLWGRVHIVYRQRGKKPEHLTNYGGADVGGRVPEALRKLNLAVVRHMPGREEYAETLESMLITIPDVEVRAEVRRAQRNADG